jgi:multidrug efflux pump
MSNSATRFTDIFIKRPVLSIVVSLIILLVGTQSFRLLPLRQYPLLDLSKINVSISYPGANPQLVENFITTPVESTLSGLEGVDYITSDSSQNLSNITINFHLGYDIDRANSDITNAVSSVRHQLPEGTLDPIISKADPNANPVMYLSFYSKTIPQIQIGSYLEHMVKPQLANLPGVSDVEVLTAGMAMRLWLDPQKMAAQNISATDISNAIKNNNVKGAFGQIESKDQTLILQGNTGFTTAEQFNIMPIKLINNQIIRLNDVGTAEIGADNYNNSSFANGDKTSIMSITPTEKGNPLLLAEMVYKLLPGIQAHLPQGLAAKPIWDSSKFIRASLNDVTHTLILSTLCVLLVIFLFLGSLRAIFIPFVTIPLSLIGVSSIMLLLGYSLNTLTLLAWVLAIGLVVDDAIYILENIYRHIEEGKTPYQAALIGTREISFAVIAMSLTLAAVYAPIGFLSNLTGVLFREFSFTLAASVIISGVIALTLTPMMCSKLLQPIQKKSFSQKIDLFFHHVITKYQKILNYVLHHPKFVVGTAIVLYSAALLLFHLLPSELAPMEDQGLIFTAIQAPTSANINYIEQATQPLNQIYQSIPEGEDFGIINHTNTAFSFLTLKPWGERKRSSSQIIAELIPKMAQIPGIIAFPVNLPALPGGGGNNAVNIVLKSTGDWAELEQAADQLKSLIKQNTKLLNVMSSLNNDQLVLNLDIDRNKASTLGINMSDLANSMNILLGEPTLDYFEQRGETYPIIPQIFAAQRQDPSQLAQIPLRTLSNQIVPLGSLTQFSQSAKPQSLSHFQKLRSISVTANLAPGYSLGEALTYLTKTANTYLATNIQIDYAGSSRQFIESQGALGQVFIFALLFIFLILAAQFESFRNPLIVMIAVPLSLFGALLTMNLTHCTLNIYTEIGLVTLIGLISKHSILMVEFADQILASGKSVFEAAYEAAGIRFRPILMTTGAMLLGAVPLILADGAGSHARQQLGWVIAGGMSIGTLFTLFIIPVAYILIAKKRTSK